VAVVTGAAGFIGSHLCSALLDGGEQVRGVDCFTDYYSRAWKEANLSGLRERAGFSFLEQDLSSMDLRPVLEDAGVVYHLAGQPGVRASWGANFEVYTRNNIGVTQLLLEASKDSPMMRKFVYASSSSVYGDAESYPTVETLRPRPVSPYGVTKLAAEHMCELYRKSFGVPTVSLRLFTVYGPRQRPDMAFAKLVRASLDGTPFELFGDGEQTRDFTYVGDVVDAFRGASLGDWCGVANIGGGARTSMKDVLALVEGMCGSVEIIRSPSQIGDVRDTASDTNTARAAFGYRPRVSLIDGLARMVEWQRGRLLVAAR
jgi:nucleoside-diphosphate-sugar epimerase